MAAFFRPRGALRAEERKRTYVSQKGMRRRALLGIKRADKMNPTRKKGKKKTE